MATLSYFLQSMGIGRPKESGLFYALDLGSVLEAQAILSDPNTSDEDKRKAVLYRGGPDKWTTLMASISHCKAPFEINRQLVDYGGIELVMGRDGFAGRTALHCASGRDPPDVETVALLVKEGGRELVNIQSRNRGITALHEVCQESGNAEVIKLLLQVGGAELASMKTKDGMTAMDYLSGAACQSSRRNEAFQLLQKSLGAK